MKRSLLSKSSLMAVGLAAAVVIWMLTGLGGGATAPRDAAPASAGTKPAAAGVRDNHVGQPAEGEADGGGARPAGLRVSVRHSVAERIVRNVVVSGRTEPSRTVEVKAETEGRVTGLGVERGRPIAAGETIATLDVRERRALLEEAEALVAQRRLQYEAAMQLESRQLVAQAQIAEAKALLESAEAQLEGIRLDLERTTIVAPFDGVLEERDVELGDYVGVGDPIALVVDNDPLIGVGEVSEREISSIEVGTAGRAQLLNGKIIEGQVRYVSPVADANTRTFRIELAIANPDNRLPAGMTAELRLPADEVEAHFLSPALLTLDDEGKVGVKTVDEQNRVRFDEVEIVRSASDGVWVTGLPPEALVITIGQGFVAVGETVEPVQDDRP